MKTKITLKDLKGKNSLLIGVLFFLILCIGAYYFTKNTIFFWILPPICAVYVFFYFYNKKESEKRKKKQMQDSFLRFLVDFRIAIRIDDDVENALKEAFIYQNKEMQEEGQKLIDDMHIDSSIAPFFHFASQFPFSHAQEWMTAIYYLKQNHHVDAFFAQTDSLLAIEETQKEEDNPFYYVQFLPNLAGVLLFITWMIAFFLYLGGQYGQ